MCRALAYRGAGRLIMPGPRGGLEKTKKRMKSFRKPLMCLLALTLSAASANAWHLIGRVKCPDQLVLEGAVVSVTGSTALGAFAGSAATDAAGNYTINLPDAVGTFIAVLDENSLPEGTSVIGSASVPFETTATDTSRRVDFAVDNCQETPPPPPPALACWFTGGGAKIDQLLGIPAAHKGPQHSFGGNVNPGCSPTAGQGGNWNHVARDLKLHFKGTAIQVVECGNVPQPPPNGSTSPVTPFNYIEFVGTGTLKGIQGNKADFGQVTFFGRCEDRNEPGTKPANAGTGIDRYYLRVVDGTGVTRLLISGSTDPNVVAPVEITDGNFQLHISSCDDPPTP